MRFRFKTNNGMELFIETDALMLGLDLLNNQDTLFTKKELSELTGIGARRILDWTSRGYLVPFKKIEGQGRISYYDFTNAVEARALELLSKNGVCLNNEWLRGVGGLRAYLTI